MMNYMLKVLLVVSITLHAACSQEPTIETAISLEATTETSINFLALGDSYTIGQGVEEQERWPNQLRNQLKENRIFLKETKIIAQTGWTTRNLLNAMETADLKNFGANSIVSLLIGVNNQYQNTEFEIFKSEYDQLVDNIIQITGSTTNIFLVSIPDYGVTPFAAANGAQIAQELNTYNAYIASKAKELSIPFVDITEISRSLGANTNALATDLLHPSAFQYGLWVEEIVPVIKNIVLKINED